ncbi:Polygalacturonase [Vitis vinifera]|uniref:Polygalacturonase n=1 Tax=Vitis vinifera TaxID=29760 RepID=A0A438GI14_VITVI|nr:Polygalacturonase [Vitis vinifera]
MAKMGLKMNITATSLLLLLASSTEVFGDTIFYVTKYDAKADGNTDITQALLNAWRDACASPVVSTVMIPDGTYALGQITIGRPYKAPINFNVQGTVKSPMDTSRFKAEAGWIAFQQIDQFILSYGGVFYGQAKPVWGRKCPSSAYCNQLPIVSSCVYIYIYIYAYCTKVSINTDGIHIGRSSGFNTTNSTVETGDDCVSIGDGMSRTAPSPQNGVRVKTWPTSHQGTASKMHFEDIVMNDVANPKIKDQEVHHALSSAMLASETSGALPQLRLLSSLFVIREYHAKT